MISILEFSLIDLCYVDVCHDLKVKYYLLLDIVALFIMVNSWHNGFAHLL